MKILVLGGTGRTGKLVVEKGLAKGHDIVTLVRSPEKMPSHDRLSVIKGLPTNLADISNAVDGCDAIIVALNNPRTSDAPWAKPISTDKILTQTAQNITQLEGIKRVVYMSAVGVGDSFDDTMWLMRFMIKRTNLSYAYDDHNSAEQLLRESSLDWTLVRPVGLSNDNKVKSLIVGSAKHPKPSMMISRNTVAEFLLDCVENNSHVHEAPVISEK